MEMYDNLVHSLYLFLLVTKGKGVQYPLITPSLIFLKLRPPPPEKTPWPPCPRERAVKLAEKHSL